MSLSRPWPASAKLLPHPLADCVPMMSDDEFTELRKSLRNRGFFSTHKIVMYEGKILDGRNRYLACLAEQIEPEFEDYVGDDPHGYVLGNITRRDLDTSKRALVVADIVARQAEYKNNRQTQMELRRIFDVGETILTDANRVLAKGVPDLRRMIENGEITVTHAAQVARLPEKEQKKVVAAGPDSVISKARQLRKVREGTPAAKSPDMRPALRPQAQRPVDAFTAEILRDIKMLAAKLTRYIGTSDGKRFEQYVQLLDIPDTIDYSGVKITDKGEGLEKHGPKFVGLKDLYRLLVAATRDRAYAASDLRKLLKMEGDNPLDGDQRPIEPENDPGQLVEPESL